MEGVQISGGVNFVRKTINGVQIAGIFNFAHKINGTQIGVFNYADSSNGLSIGFLSFVKNGKKTISIGSNDFAPLNISYKSGNFKLYNIIQVSGQIQKNNQMLSVGYGLGYNHHPLRKWQIIHELGIHTIYAGNWNDQNLLLRYQFLIQRKLNKAFSIYCGPTINFLYHENSTVYTGFKAPFQHSYPSYKINNNLALWLGWTAGINLW